MFKTRRTKILSVPAEEVLEVVAPEPAKEPEPVVIVVHNIEQLTISYQDEMAATGELIDSAGGIYEYNWDKKLKRISSLSGKNINSLVWMLCDTVLQKYYVRPESIAVEIPVELKIAEALKIAITPVLNSIKMLENKVVTARPMPAPVQQIAQRPQMIQSAPAMPTDTPAINVADSDISANAMRYLQQSREPDLDIDYMSL
jgi:hypothetical protein